MAAANPMSMLVSIDEALLNALENQNLFQVRDVDIEKLKEGVAHPAVFAAIETGTLKKVTKVVVRCQVKISLVVLFQHLASEKARRHGLYPMLEGIIKLFSFQKLGLKIAAILPVRFHNITNAKIKKMGLCAYEIELATSFDIRKTEAEDTAFELLKIGIKYYLQDPADDGNPDAEDEITLTP